jgi:3-oxoacyl-[acyl-carrier protein] reductase
VNLGIKGKVAVVAGASSGIGRAIAEVLSEEQANVAVLSRSKDKLERATVGIKEKTGGQVIAVPADVTDKKEVERAVSTMK